VLFLKDHADRVEQIVFGHVEIAAYSFNERRLFAMAVASTERRLDQ
jgi:hypothetical protein